MDMKRCNKGHFFDGEKYQSCPYCQPSGEAASPTAPVTIPGTGTGKGNAGIPKPINVDPIPPTQPSPNGAGGVTIGIYKHKNVSPVVGWFVCIKGEHKGEDFTLRTGKNFIGRSREMDVVLSKDEAVSRNKHAIVLYDPKSNMFIAQPGESRELTYLNDAVLLNPQELHKNDVLTVGRSELMFIPFCSDTFKWEDEKEEKEAK